MTRVLTTFGLTSHRTIVPIGGAVSGGVGGVHARRIEIGGNAIVLVAGPRVIEGRAMILDLARALHAGGASIVRGGSWRPPASAHALHGLALDALEFLAESRATTGAPIATEVLDPRDVDQVSRIADLMIVGEGSMQNRPLLAEVGRTGRPVLLERGGAATLDELLEAAEHIMAHGNPHVVLCERGIRTFEPGVPAVLDIAAIPRLKALTHLPVVVAPGEASARADLVAPLACGAVAAGADGLLLEVLPRPASGTDFERTRHGSLGIEAFAALVDRLGAFATAAGRTLARPEPSGGAGSGVDPSDASPAERRTPDALAALRSGIEQVDRRIIELIGQRVELARGAGRVKRDAGLPVIDEDQEHEVLARVRALATSAGLPQAELHALQAYLIEISRRAQTHPGHPSPSPD